MRTDSEHTVWPDSETSSNNAQTMPRISMLKFWSDLVRLCSDFYRPRVYFAINSEEDVRIAEGGGLRLNFSDEFSLSERHGKHQFDARCSNNASQCTQIESAEKIAKAAQRQRSAVRRSGPCTPSDIEELIHSLVRTSPADGFVKLLPHTSAEFYYKPGSAPCHISMLNELTAMATASSLAAMERWRRFLGQQLMLLAELVVFCVPEYFADHSAAMSTILGKGRLEEQQGVI
jgi:hypothetical protein